MRREVNTGGGVNRLRDDEEVSLICPTYQVFLQASMPACYFAWGCFRYFGWAPEPRRPALVFPDNGTIANGKSDAEQED
jgi:hypothetical protein